MIFKKTKQRLFENIPWYVNKSLPAKESIEIEKEVNRDTHARDQKTAWEQIQTALINQPIKNPPPIVEQRVFASIHESSIKVTQKRYGGWEFLSGILLTVSILIILWLAIQPGVVLQWSSKPDGVIAYRIYRTTKINNQFELIKEIPFRSGNQQYNFVDCLLYPGQKYLYKVEEVHSNGKISSSPIVNGHSEDVFPAQLALLVTSIIAGFGLVIFTKKLPLASVDLFNKLI